MDFPHAAPLLDSMFHLKSPIIEKIARPVLVYLAIIVLLRIFGKRELAQLNPFDLVVLLSVSNTVQNAIRRQLSNRRCAGCPLSVRDQLCCGAFPVPA